jgi:hypothetical protein
MVTKTAYFFDEFAAVAVAIGPAVDHDANDIGFTHGEHQVRRQP